MEGNRYAPPKAAIEGASEAAGTAPALWNPNATANWSLLFTPIFGAWLQMKNWEALGETRRAASSKAWLVVSAVLVGGSVLVDLLLPQSLLAALTTPIGFLVLVVWYFASGRRHARWVDQRFGTDYPRRGWTPPLLWGAAGYLVVFAAGVLIGLAASPAH